MILALGIIIGILLSFLALFAGKKFEVVINNPDRYLNINKTIPPPSQMARIISRKDPIEEIINQ
jgi:hypothetical protein